MHKRRFAGQIEPLEPRRLRSSSILKDINAGTGDSNPSGFVQVGQSVFFIAQGSDGNEAVYKTDGTPNGTTLVTEPPSLIPASPQLDAGTSSLFYFVTENTGPGAPVDKLYRSDGTAAGTYAVDTDSRFNIDWANNGQIAALANGTVVFSSSQSDPTAYLSKSDGTLGETGAVGTQPGAPIQDLVSGVGSSHAFFVSPISASEQDGLWVTDGTTAGTKMLIALPAAPDDGISNLIAAGSIVYFTENDPTLGYTLWRSDGTAAGTFQISSAEASWSPDLSNTAVVGTTLYFGADTGDQEMVYQTDGTFAGTTEVPGVTVDAGSLGAMTAFNGGVLFEAGDSQPALWSYAPGQSAATQITTLNSTPGNFVVAGSDAYFVNFDPSIGSYEIWRTDGTASGTIFESYDQTPNTGFIDGVGIGDRLIYDGSDNTGDGFEPHYAPLTSSTATLQLDAPSAEIQLSFSHPINPGTLSNADLDLVHVGVGQISDGSLSLSTAANANSATVQYTVGSHGILPDGNYTIALDGADGVTDAGGGPVDAATTSSFFFLMADANHDRTVNSSDFAILAANYGKTGMHFSQGDFNYDGTVNVLDFNVLATHFGANVAAPVQSSAPAAAKPLSSVFSQSPQIDADLDDSILIGDEPASAVQ